MVIIACGRAAANDTATGPELPITPARPVLSTARAPSQQLLTPIRRHIESIQDTLTPHGGRPIDEVGARTGHLLLTLTTAIWHNHATGAPVAGS
jgi:hypothetical protein